MNAKVPPRSRRRTGAWRAQALPYMLVAPFVLVIFGFLLYPLGDALYLSLTHWRLLYQQNPVFVGPSTYRQLVDDSEFWSSLWRTCEWTAGTVAVEFVVGFPLALALNYRTRLTGLATGLILLPWVTP